MYDPQRGKELFGLLRLLKITDKDRGTVLCKQQGGGTANP
jgi:hypothetical protein